MNLNFFDFLVSRMYAIIPLPSKVVITAVILSASAVLGLTFYAFSTKTDFTMLGGLLFVLMFISMGLSMLTIYIKAT